MSDTKDMERRIADLELKCQLLQHVVFALTDAVQPQGIQYAILALIYGFTADQMAALNDFWKWASQQDKSQLTKEALIREFDARMHEALRGKLEQILRADQADGRRPLYCRLVLGEESRADESGEP